MFTGLVEAVGEITEVRDGSGERRLRLQLPASWADELKPGDSLAVSGVCQTVETCAPGTASVVAVAETLRKTTLGGLRPGDRVNLERPVRVGDRLGGHLVQGHVDGVGRVSSLVHGGGADVVCEVEVPSEFRRYAVPRGSIAIDGISLTVARTTATGVAVTLIPSTLAATTAGAWAEASEVNLEMDILGRYVERLLAASAGGLEGGA